SHSSARALVPGDRQLSDEMIRAIGSSGGVVGLPLYNRFLDAAWAGDTARPVTVADQFRAHVEHVAGLVGWDRVAVGAALDGGFGRDETLVEVDTVAAFGRIGDAFEPDRARDLLGATWLRYLRATLPA